MSYRNLLKMDNAKVRAELLDIDPGLKDEIDEMDPGRMRRMLGSYTIDDEVSDRSDITDQYSGTREVFAPWRWMYFDFPDHFKTLYYDEVGYRTASGNCLSILIHLLKIKRTKVPLLTEWEQVTFCGLCGGTSGGCPGYAPRFDTIRKNEEYLYVLAASFDQAWAMKYGYTKSWKYTVMYGDRLTQSYTRRIMDTVNELGFGLGLGSCEGKCKVCPVVVGEDPEHRHCLKPLKRSYSLEATGVDCDRLHKSLYGEYMPWGFIGLNKSPLYLTRYAGVLTDKSDSVVLRTLKESVVNDKSYILEVPEAPEYDVEEVVIPTGVHEDYMQFMYNLKPE